MYTICLSIVHVPRHYVPRPCTRHSAPRTCTRIITLLRAKALRTHFVLFARVAFALLMYTNVSSMHSSLCSSSMYSYVLVPRPVSYTIRCTHVYSTDVCLDLIKKYPAVAGYFII